MIEIIFAFILSKNFALGCSAAIAVLGFISSAFLGNKHKKAKDTVEMMIQAIEITQNKNTKQTIKNLAEGHARIKQIDFQAKVKEVTDGMKEKGLKDVKTIVEDIEAQTAAISNIKALISAFKK